MEFDELNEHQKIQVAKGFDATPELIPFIPYLLQDLFELGSSPKIISEILKSLELGPKSKLLDIACGKGAVSIQIAQRLGFSCKGIDLFKPFIEIEREKALEAGVSNLCNFEVNDINNVIFKEKNYAAMSDLHLGSLLGRQWLHARVDQVHAQQPDLVVLLGDIFEVHGKPGEELLSVLHRLSAPLGVWADLGNHEFHGSRNAGSPLIYYDGIRVLNNTWTELRPGLVLAGVDDLTANHRSGQGGDPISRSLEGRPPGATVLLSHPPWEALKAAKAGAGLMLSGHTHGGLIWPFGYLVQHVYPLLGGRYEVNGMTVIVCRGTGTWGPRMRLWRPGEILRVTLRGV